MNNKKEHAIAFELEKMKRFVQTDALLRFSVKDLMSKGHKEEYALEIVFNTYVLEDSVMEAAYNAL